MSALTYVIPGKMQQLTAHILGAREPNRALTLLARSPLRDVHRNSFYSAHVRRKEFEVLKSHWRVALVVFGSGIATPVAGQPLGRIDGVVQSKRNETRIAGVAISIDEGLAAARSDAHGRFRIDGVPFGTHIVSAHRVGFRASTDTVQVAARLASSMVISLVEAPTLIDEVTVTPGRGEQQKLKELPVSVDVLSGAEIANMRPTHVGETLNRFAGVRIVEFDGDQSDNAIRQPLCCRATILYMEDGIPFAPSSYSTPGMLAGVNYAQAGRIEVLKGPGTAPYGSDAISGVVNFISSTPSLSAEAQVTAEQGANGYKRALLSASKTFGANGLLFNGSFVDTDGRRGDPFRRQSVDFHWNSMLSNGASLHANVSYTQRDGTASDNQAPEQFQERSDFNQYPIAFDNWKNARASISYQQTNRATSWRFTPYFRYQESDRVPGWQLSYNPVVWDVDYHSVGFLSQSRHTYSKLNAALTIGIDGDFSPLSRREPVITPVKMNGVWVDWSLKAQPPHYDYEANYKNLSGYTELEFDITHALRLSVGARYDWSQYNYHTHIPALQTGSFRVPADTNRAFTKATPKIGAVYALNRETRLFASYRRGFRVPLESQLFAQGRSLNSTTIRPVEVEATEIGIRSAVGARARAELSVYNMQLHHDILSYRATTGVSTLTNNGETSHRGVELTGGVALRTNLRANISYSYAIHRFDAWQPSSTLNLSGHDMDGAPRHLGNGTLTYQPMLLKGGQLQLEWSGMSGYWLDQQNTTPFTGYNVLHLRASYIVARRAELYLRVMNLTDRLYAVQAFEGDGTVPWFAAAGEYRTAYGGLQIRF